MVLLKNLTHFWPQFDANYIPLKNDVFGLVINRGRSVCMTFNDISRSWYREDFWSEIIYSLINLVHIAFRWSIVFIGSKSDEVFIELFIATYHKFSHYAAEEIREYWLSMRISDDIVPFCVGSTFPGTKISCLLDLHP